MANFGKDTNLETLISFGESDINGELGITIKRVGSDFRVSCKLDQASIEEIITPNDAASFFGQDGATLILGTSDSAAKTKLIDSYKPLTIERIQSKILGILGLSRILAKKENISTKDFDSIKSGLLRFLSRASGRSRDLTRICLREFDKLEWLTQLKTQPGASNNEPKNKSSGWYKFFFTVIIIILIVIVIWFVYRSFHHDVPSIAPVSGVVSRPISSRSTPVRTASPAAESVSIIPRNTADV
jgi:hypothetical protein